MEMEKKEGYFDFAIDGEYLYQTKTGCSQITDAAWRVQLNVPEVSIRFVRGDKMRTVERLFDEFAAAFQFPYYFGENWPAFGECIADLEWLDNETYVVVVTNAHQMLANESVDELHALFRCFRKAYSELVEQNKRFFVIFQDTVDAETSNLSDLDPNRPLIHEIKIERFW